MAQAITRLYDNRTHAEQAMRALRSAGLTDDQVSIVANRGTDAATDPDAVSDAGAVTGGAAGGLVGSLTGDGMSEADANVYAEGIRRGGSMVTARVPDDREAEVRRILDGYPSVEPGIRGAEYRRDGWERFDDSAAPYVPTVRRN